MATPVSVEALNDYLLGVDSDGHHIGEILEEFTDTPFGPIKEVYQRGGEGQGEEYVRVVEVQGRLFRADAYYNSWDGTDWYNASFYEVEPVEKTYIDYVKVEK